MASSKAGISEMLEGHQGPITGIHCHTAAGPLDFSHLFVTSSFDWTVKLWSTKVPPPPRSPMMQRVYWVVLSEIDERLAHILLSFMLQSNRPLYSFEDNSDYVYDVMWSPAHPALFACVDGVGHLDLWNLNSDTEVRPPICAAALATLCPQTVVA